MSFPFGHYDEAQLEVLRKALERVCRELGYRESNISDRERVALALMAVAQSWPCDVDKLVAETVARFHDIHPARRWRAHKSTTAGEPPIEPK
jgi:hypothetical protein